MDTVREVMKTLAADAEASARPLWPMPIDKFIAGPYVRQGAVVSTRYSTVNLLRTLEDVLGIGPMTLNDAYARPMSDAFDIRRSPHWTYAAAWPAPLTATRLPQPAATTRTARWRDRHDAAWWAAQTAGYDWTREDRAPTRDYNRVLWRGLMPGQRHPPTPGAGNGDRGADAD